MITIYNKKTGTKLYTAPDDSVLLSGNEKNLVIKTGSAVLETPALIQQLQIKKEPGVVSEITDLNRPEPADDYDESDVQETD